MRACQKPTLGGPCVSLEGHLTAWHTDIHGKRHPIEAPSKDKAKKRPIPCKARFGGVAVTPTMREGLKSLHPGKRTGEAHILREILNEYLREKAPDYYAPPVLEEGKAAKKRARRRARETNPADDFFSLVCGVE